MGTLAGIRENIAFPREPSTYDWRKGARFDNVLVNFLLKTCCHLCAVVVAYLQGFQRSEKYMKGVFLLIYILHLI